MIVRQAMQPQTYMLSWALEISSAMSAWAASLNAGVPMTLLNGWFARRPPNRMYSMHVGPVLHDRILIVT